MPIAAKNKTGLIEIFETLSLFPERLMMLKSGDYMVDAHSIMGVFSMDITNPIELLMEEEPDMELKNAISKFAPALVKSKI